MSLSGEKNGLEGLFVIIHLGKFSWKFSLELFLKARFFSAFWTDLDSFMLICHNGIIAMTLVRFCRFLVKVLCFTLFCGVYPWTGLFSCPFLC